MPIVMLVPAGVGKGGSPIGTRDWADYVRLHSHAVVDEAIERPAEFKKIHDFIVEHRAWTLMNKPDGSFFTTIEEFSAHRRPWGWSRPYDELRPFLAIAAGKMKIATPAGPVAADGEKVLALATAPVDGRQKNGANQHTGPREDTHPRGEYPPPRRDARPDALDLHPRGENPRTPGNLQRVQAILRAPVEAQALYKAGLLGEKTAAKLGPRGTTKAPLTPAKAARVREAVNAAEAIVREQGAPKDDRAKRALKQKVDAEVRRVLGDEPKARSAVDLRRATLALAPAERMAFVLWLLDQLEADERARVAAHAAASTSELPSASGARHGGPAAHAAARA
jgi:hypothetical protein